MALLALLPIQRVVVLDALDRILLHRVFNRLKLDHWRVVFPFYSLTGLAIFLPVLSQMIED